MQKRWSFEGVGCSMQGEIHCGSQEHLALGNSFNNNIMN